jgi:hypothetical protein
MIVMPLAAAAVLIAAVGSELAVRGAKLQTALPRALAVWCAAYAAAAVWILTNAAAGLVALTLFWAGVFLAWFGIRSHIESSILLRMLFMLRRDRMSDAEIVAEYTRRHGESARLAELRRGGLIVGETNRMRVTPKGRAILSLASRLR